MDAASKETPGSNRTDAKEHAVPPPDPVNGRPRTYLLAASVALLTFIVYLPALRNGFVWDDVLYVIRSPFIRSLNGNLLRSAFLTFQAENWHPLTWLSHAFDYFLWGSHPLGHHLTNIVLHALTTLLVVILLMRLMEARQLSAGGGSSLVRRRALVACGISGLLFGLHPLHVESVAWVSERKDLLCALFFLLSVLAYAAAVRKRKLGARPRSFLADRNYLLALCLFVLALLSKPMAVTLPVVLLILDWYPFGRIRSLKTLGTATREKIPFFALSAASSVLTILAQKTGGAMSMMQPVPLSTRALVAARSVIVYLAKVLVPVDLVPYYPYPERVSLFSGEYLTAIVLVSGITLFCIVTAKRQKLFPAAAGYYIVTLLPVLGLVQVGTQAMADRYMYLPSIGPLFLIGMAVAILEERVRNSRHAVARKFPIAAVTAVILFSVLTYTTICQIGIWKNNVVLWNSVLADEPPHTADSPGYAMAHNNLGLAYASQGRWDPATVEFQRAIQLDPDDIEPHYNLGVAYASRGRLEDAIAEYRIALRLDPDSAGAHNNLGIAYAAQGRLNDAVAEFQTTARLKPDDAEPHANLGFAYASQGRWDKATAEFQIASQMRPDDARPHYNLGNAYAAQGLWDKAAEEYRTALRLQPDFPEAGRRLREIVSRGN